jgi:hypothetical protein
MNGSALKDEREADGIALRCAEQRGAKVTDSPKTRAPLGVYAIIALVLAVAERQTGHAGIAVFLGRWGGSLLLVAAVGEIIRAFTRKRKRPEPPPPRAAAGKTISTEAVLKHLLESKTTYDGPNREEYVFEIDRLADEFRKEHGPQISLAQAYAMVKEIEARVGRVERR